MFRIISNIVGIQAPLSAGMAILSLGIDHIPVAARTIVTHILLSTRAVIMRHWKDTKALSVKEVVETTNTHATYELMFAAAQGNYLSMSSRRQHRTDWYQPNDKGQNKQ